MHKILFQEKLNFILGIKIPFSVVLISSIEEVSGVISSLEIPIDCAYIGTMLTNEKISNMAKRVNFDFIGLFLKLCNYIFFYG